MDEFNVNDGNGLYDNLGLIDTLIEDCNEIPKDLLGGNYVRFCGRIVQMVQKLAKLKTGVENDTKSLRNQLVEMRQLNDELANQNLKEGKG